MTQQVSRLTKASLCVKKSAEAGGQLRQAKARVLLKAAPEGLADVVPAGGSLAVVGAEDIAAVAKIINKLAKDEKVVVRAGMIDGKAYDAKGAARFADLPTKTEAQAMVLRAMRAPVVKLGRIAKAPVRRLGRALQAHKEKLEG